MAVDISKKIVDFGEFDLLDILFNFEASNNCELGQVSYYISKDGKSWELLNSSSNNKSVRIENKKRKYKHIRAVANTRFFSNGILTCDYVKIAGTNEEKEDVNKETAGLTLENDEPLFHIFSFNHQLNIETQDETPFEVMITSISGQIVYRDQFTGSTRIELPADLSGVFIVSIIQKNAFQASKKISV